MKRMVADTTSVNWVLSFFFFFGFHSPPATMVPVIIELVIWDYLSYRLWLGFEGLDGNLGSGTWLDQKK